MVRALALTALLFNPEEKFILRDDDPVADLHGWEFSAVRQVVGSGSADAQYLRYVRYREHQRQIVISLIAGFIHLGSPHLHTA